MNTKQVTIENVLIEVQPTGRIIFTLPNNMSGKELTEFKKRNYELLKQLIEPKTAAVVIASIVIFATEPKKTSFTFQMYKADGSGGAYFNCVALTYEEARQRVNNYMQKTNIVRQNLGVEPFCSVVLTRFQKPNDHEKNN